MKKIIKSVGLLALFIPVVALAATYLNEVNVEAGKTIEGNLYLAGKNPSIAGTINGDLFSAGGNVDMTGKVINDAMLAGGDVKVNGDVGGDLRAAGGTITVNGVVGGEAMLFAGDIVLGPKAVITGDLVANGGTVTVDPSAKISGKQIINRGEDASATGKDAKVDYWNLYILPEIWAIVGLLIVAAGLGLIEKGQRVERVINRGILEGSAGMNVLYGFAVLILVPVAAIMLMASGVGALMAIIILLLYVALILISSVFGGLIFGALMQSVYEKKSPINFHWAWMLGGVTVSHLLTLVPYVGWIFGLVFFLLAMGTLVTLGKKENKI